MPGNPELVTPTKGGKRYTRHDPEGQFTSDQTDVGRSLSHDRRQRSQTVAKPGCGDKGDRPARKGPRRARRP